MHLDFPYSFTDEGQTVRSDDQNYIRDLIEQIIFTNPGERVNRPRFGSGLLQSIFEPNSDEMAATLQYLIQSSLNQWLGTIIEVGEVQLHHNESTLQVIVTYTELRTHENQTVTISRTI